MNTVEEPESAGCDIYALKNELLLAMETARNHLAIAIAEESKSTPAARRQYYLDTVDHIRHCIGKFRNGDGDHEGFCQQDWISMLEALKKVSLKNRAQTLCEDLHRIMTVLG